MSDVQIVLGPSGSGKSTYVMNEILKAATDNPKQSYLVVVPDQFTMQTQSDFVKMSPGGGIMNIDVLSFSRLAHRVFEETGGGRKPVLDDTGKNLVLRKCAVDVRDRIPYLAGNIDKAGYIHEIKSAISEFMQYGIDSKELESLSEYARIGNKRTLNSKIKDLTVIYDYFRTYIKDNYITGEEALDILAEELGKSKIVADSIVIFDGFTGFTPVQNRVIGALMEVAQSLIFTVCMDEKSAMTEEVNEAELFSFSKKTYLSIRKIAKEHNACILDDIVLSDSHRFESTSALEFLEKNIFRYSTDIYSNAEKASENVRLNMALSIPDEVRMLIKNIRYLIKEGVCYRDIAVITGNLESYKSEIEEQFEDYDIPVFIDETRNIVLNPFVEYICSVLRMFEEDFTYETVFRYLRTGFTCLNIDETDRLENYVVSAGIRGKSAYTRLFTRKGNGTLESVQDIRDRFVQELSPFLDAKVGPGRRLTASQYIEVLYSFLVKTDAHVKLAEYAAMFEAQNDNRKCREYSQVYEHTLKMFEQVHDLLGDEEMSLDEFAGILEAGFSEIKVGAIPQSVDRVIVGDMERTRLKPIKYLFFLGLNDGWVPKAGGSGGIISDYEREYLVTSGVELAPSPREKIYIDRFYMYINLTKPSKRLYLSYLAMDNEAKAMKPSYIVESVGEMFPGVDKISHVIGDGFDTDVESVKDAKRLYSSLSHRFADGVLTEAEEKTLRELSSLLAEDREFLDKMITNAFFRYENESLDSRVAALLYGTSLYGSISRMENYAKCAHSYFLRYGLNLMPKAEYGATAADMGNIYHGVLEIFKRKLDGAGLTWFDFTEEDAARLIDEAVEEETAGYTDAIMFETDSNRYIVDRMKSVMLRTVKTLAYQLRKSEYSPIEYEMEFGETIDLDRLQADDGKHRKLKFTGKIDRLDVCESSDKVYVKVVDYKSGNKDFSLMSFYHGVQLQMVVYMDAAINALKKRPQYENREVLPAAMLYYHIDDPMITCDAPMSDEAIEDKIRRELRTKGIINASDEVVSGLDNSGADTSDVIPVGHKKDGSFTASSSVMSGEDMKVLSDYASHKLIKISEEIISGDISLNPFEIKSGTSTVVHDSCKYCDYKHICGFDEHMPGYVKTSYQGEDDADIIGRMKAELGGDATMTMNEEEHHA